MTAPADRRKSSHRLCSHRLSEEKRQRILLTCNQPEFAALPPGQIVPILADRGLYNSFGEDCVYGSERSFYRVLNDKQPGPPAGAGQASSGTAAGASA